MQGNVSIIDGQNHAEKIKLYTVITYWPGSHEE